jgi:hypothetical protein
MSSQEGTKAPPNHHSGTERFASLDQQAILKNPNPTSDGLGMFRGFVFSEGVSNWISGLRRDVVAPPSNFRVLSASLPPGSPSSSGRRPGEPAVGMAAPAPSRRTGGFRTARPRRLVLKSSGEHASRSDRNKPGPDSRSVDVHIAGAERHRMRVTCWTIRFWNQPIR